MLRDYQLKALDLIKEEFLNGHKKVLLWMATGGGKTVVFCEMIKRVRARNKKVIVVVRGRKLVDQASERLHREKVEHGVLMAKHWNYRPHLPVQVCSIDTLIARELKPDADLIVIDEAHLASSKGYKKFLQQYDAHIIAVTATPYSQDPIRHVADTYVHPVSMQELIDLGFLVDFRIFAPSKPDLKGVRIVNDEYKVEDLEKPMSVLTGNIVEHWFKLAKDLPTICFAVSVTHSILLRDAFLAAGVEAEHVDASSTDAERNAAIRRLEKGETKIICNVGILCTGVDIPCLGAIIMARPTRSLNLFIQQAGRGTRPFPGKQKCILLDHSGNTQRHGKPKKEPPPRLDGAPKRSRKEEDEEDTLIKQCPQCFCMCDKHEEVCGECGYIFESSPRMPPSETDEQLVELDDVREDPIEIELARLKTICNMRGYKKSWVNFRLWETFGTDALPYMNLWWQNFFKQKLNEQQQKPSAPGAQDLERSGLTPAREAVAQESGTSQADRLGQTGFIWSKG